MKREDVVLYAALARAGGRSGQYENEIDALDFGERFAREAEKRGLISEPRVDQFAGWQNEVVDLVRQNEVIRAIKLFREHTGWGLLDAKNVCVGACITGAYADLSRHCREAKVTP